MDMLSHLRLMAGYNYRLNRQIFAGAAGLSEAQLQEPMGAYFGSVLGTLNHLLVGDLIWLGRFSQHSAKFISLRALTELPQPKRLDQIMYDRFGALSTARILIDESILTWAQDELTLDDLGRPFTYVDTRGEASTRTFGELVCHLFNHQTHHRGQVSTLLYQLGVDIGVTDFLADIPRLPTGA